MKATIERATLLKGLGHVHSVVERRNTIPILSNVLIEADEEGGIRLMATDLDLQINEKTRFAISTEETRYYLNGIYVHVSDDTQPVLKAAATDGHRLARVTVP